MIKVNLQPKVTLEAREGLRLPLWLPVIITIIVLGGIGSTYWMSNQRKLDAEAEIRELDFKLRDFQKIIADYEQVTHEKEYLKGKRDFVQGISENQKQWISFFDQLREKIPKDVWLTRFTGARSGDYDIEGSTYTFASVGFFMLQLNSITQVQSVTLEATAVGSPRGGTGTKEGGGADLNSITKSFKVKGGMELAGQKAPEKDATQGQQGKGNRPPLRRPVN
jgi:Tfp pilus assembly protein PilN